MYISKRLAALLGGAVAVVIIGMAIGMVVIANVNDRATVGTTDDTGSQYQTDRGDTGRYTVSTEPELPSPDEFTLEVVVLSEQCFGSAGCSVRYRVEPTYHGSAPALLDPSVVIYEVSGGQNGPQTGSFRLTMHGTAANITESSLRTSSVDAAIDATVTDVRQAR